LIHFYKRNLVNTDVESVQFDQSVTLSFGPQT